MKKLLFTGMIIILLMVIISCLPVLAEVTKEEALTEGQKIMELHEKYNNRFEENGIYGEAIVYGFDVKEAGEALAKLEALEKEVLPALQSVMGAFAEKYGTNATEINGKLFDLGIKTQDTGDVGGDFEDLYRGLENIRKSRRASSEFLAKQAETLIKASEDEFFVMTIRVEKMQQAKALLEIAHKFDTSNTGVNEMLVDIDQRITAVAEKIEKEINEKEWAGHIGDFAGPGSTGSLAQSALEYFKGNPRWNPEGKEVEILAVAVRGQWEIAETDIFGQVTQWRLPIHLAVTNKELKPDNIASVYELSILTQSGPATSQSPPFEGYWVGNSWMMRLDKVPK